MIRNRFGILLAEKGFKESRKIPILEVCRDTGLPYRTLNAWANNRVTRFDSVVIARICVYFGVSVGDLIEHTEEE